MIELPVLVHYEWRRFAYSPYIENSEKYLVMNQIGDQRFPTEEKAYKWRSKKEAEPNNEIDFSQLTLVKITVDPVRHG